MDWYDETLLNEHADHGRGEPEEGLTEDELDARCINCGERGCSCAPCANCGRPYSRTCGVEVVAEGDLCGACVPTCECAREGRNDGRAIGYDEHDRLAWVPCACMTRKDS